MKLSYKTAGSAGAWTVLFDETAVAAGPVLERFRPSFSQLIQQEPLFNSPNQFRAPRNNVFVSHPLPVFITYPTLAAALDSIKTWSELFNTNFNLKVEQGDTVHYYPNALLAGYTPDPTGVTVLHIFEFISDNLTVTEPA